MTTIITMLLKNKNAFDFSTEYAQKKEHHPLKPKKKNVLFGKSMIRVNIWI